MNRPHILLIATGGTIAMQPASSGGATPTLGAQAIAGAQDALRLRTRDLFAKPSSSIGLMDMARIAAAIDEAQAEGVDGIVITHGTETIAETGFALGLMGRWTIPIVLTGAMRHAGLPGADGPANVAAAIAVAASAQARLGEPLIVFGDEIHLASLVRKAHGSRLAAFSSDPLGPIGWVKEGRPELPLRPARSLPHLPLAGEPPSVAMLLAGSDLEPETIMAFGDAAIAGLIVAATGGGHVSARVVDALADVAQRKPVVLASRCDGGVLGQTYGYAGGEMDLIARGLIPAGRWRPEQARIMLQLLLAASADGAQIKATLAT